MGHLFHGYVSHDQRVIPEEGSASFNSGHFKHCKINPCGQNLTDPCVFIFGFYSCWLGHSGFHPKSRDIYTVQSPTSSKTNPRSWYCTQANQRAITQETCGFSTSQIVRSTTGLNRNKSGSRKSNGLSSSSD